MKIDNNINIYQNIIIFMDGGVGWGGVYIEPQKRNSD